MSVGRAERRWLAAALLLVACGTGVSALAAVSEVRADVAEARHDDGERAEEVAASLTAQIDRQEALVRHASALVRNDPGLTTASLAAWLEGVQAFDHYPELQGLGLIALGDGRCPLSVGVARGGIEIPEGYDFCSASGPGDASAARDSGVSAHVPFEFQGSTWLGLYTPVYRTALVPETVGARRGQLIGVLGTAIDPEVMLRAALRDRSGLGVVLTYRDDGVDTRFTASAGPRLAETDSVDLGQGWTARVSHPGVDASILADRDAVVLLLGGGLTSVLLAVLLVVLATGRERAVRLVGAKTEELRHQALHDSLTGLANRALVLDRAEHLLARSRRNGAPGAVLYLDLDGFKGVNDTFGHEAGDRLLQAVADRLRGAVREADTIGRLGGDEFVVLVDGDVLGAAPALVAERLLDVLRQPFELVSDHDMRVSASIGIAFVRGEGSAEDLLRDADLAMYDAKVSGRDRVVVFRPELESELRQVVELELELRGALERDEFRLVYQPVYSLEDLRLVSVEALLRWTSPSLGPLSPATFVPVLERLGLIVPVGRWVLHEACAQMADWRARGIDVAVSVNVSAVQFDGDCVLDDICSALGSSGLDPSALILEVTESAVMQDVTRSAAVLADVKALGVRVAIDDFGTGYSSLAYLQKLPIDSLKIDRSFVSGLATSSESQALVRTIVQLGRDLGLKTLAEGVETPEQAEQLRLDAVDEAQGFLLARPLEVDAIERDVLFGAHQLAHPWYEVGRVG